MKRTIKRPEDLVKEKGVALLRAMRVWRHDGPDLFLKRDFKKAARAYFGALVKSLDNFTPAVKLTWNESGHASPGDFHMVDADAGVMAFVSDASLDADDLVICWRACTPTDLHGRNARNQWTTPGQFRAALVLYFAEKKARSNVE